MKANLYHVEINVSDSKKSFPFYKDFLGYLGFRVSFEEEGIVYFTNDQVNIGVVQTKQEYKKTTFHRKNTGINHLAFRVGKKSDVDKFYEDFLKSRKISALYNTPRKFPDYSEKYYAVYFEDPDRIKLEVAYR